MLLRPDMRRCFLLDFGTAVTSGVDARADTGVVVVVVVVVGNAFGVDVVDVPTVESGFSLLRCVVAPVPLELVVVICEDL